MKSRNKVLGIAFLVLFVPCMINAQDNCTGRIEKIIGAKGSTYLIPCRDMVVLDIKTYSKYRYAEKQLHRMDSTVSGYVNLLDSLDKENANTKALLEQKVKEKDSIIYRYKNHALDATAVLEKCKTDAEGFVKIYEKKVEENKKLGGQVQQMKRQRKGFLGMSGGLAGVLLLIILL